MTESELLNGLVGNNWLYSRIIDKNKYTEIEYTYYVTL